MLIIKNLNKFYQSENGEQYHVLKDINLEIGNKGFIVILGKSGSGKSTLMNVLGGLDHYDSGELFINNKSTHDLKSHEWDSYRNTYIGFVFQEFYIIEEYTVGKNIALALELQGYTNSNIDQRVMEILAQVDLEGHENRKPSEISGGQKQRIAIARALIKDPQIILADEPTGNLDSQTGRLVLQTLKKLSKDKLVIMVTHDQQVANTYADRIIEIVDGEVTNDAINDSHMNDHIVDLDKQTIIKVPKGVKLNEQDFLQIAYYIEKQEKDVYLLVTSHNQTTDSIKQPLQRKEQISSIDENPNTTFKLKKSSLPMKHAFKLAISSLLTKKIRLSLILLLFTFSLAFVGIAATISLYDVETSSAKTFANANITYLPIQKQKYICYKEIQVDYCKDTPININDKDIAQLKEDYPNLNFAKAYDIEVPILINQESQLSRQYPYFKNVFNQLIIIDQNEAMFELRLGNYPQDNNEILITDYMANMFVEFGNIEGYDTIEDVIGLTIPIREEFKIVGIVKTDYEKFNDLKLETDIQHFNEADYDEVTSLYYRNIYMQKEDYDHKLYYLEFARRDWNEQIWTGLQFESSWFQCKENKSKCNITASFIPTHKSYEDYLIGDSRLPVNSNEMVLPVSSFYTLYPVNPDADIEEEYKRIIAMIGDDFELSVRLPIRTTNLGMWVTRSYKLVGIYDNSMASPLREPIEKQWWPYWIGVKEELEIMDNNRLNGNSKVIVQLDGIDRENLKFIKNFDQLDYKHQNEYSETLYQVESETKNIQRIFLGVGIFLALFTSFLLYSFVSSSIKNKQKDIGTLRAIGARGVDVSKIFIIEGLIIALVASILGTLAMIYGIHQINSLITKGFDQALVLIYVNWLNIFIVFALAIIVILIATFIPVKRITQMKPIQAIKKVN